MDYIVNEWRSHVKESSSRACLSDCAGGDLTRGQVEELSNRVNGWLRKNGIGKEDMVLINLERSVKPVVAAMGVWKAGAAFTIVESAYAAERIAFIYKDSNAKIELNEDAWTEILSSEPVNETAVPDPHDLCLMVYTSGTTGTPKGVIHEYGQLPLEMLSERRPDGSFRETPKSRWGLVAPLNFVASIKFIIHFYYSGGHLYVPDYDTIKNPKKLNAYFLKNRIEGIFMSPSLMRIKKDGYGPFVKYIYTGSESANNLYIAGPELGNTYTMSESLFTVCKFVIDKPYPIVPIGRPAFDLKIKLIDDEGNESQDYGELCFENLYCRGYVNNPAENERHFIDGYYHTGDLAEYKDGLYILKGRSDDMIKINGNRIEPSEIEAVCCRVMGIPHCAAKGFEKEGFVALYYTQPVEFEEEELRKKLETRLPYYMIPAYFVRIDRFPMTNSGKLNRRALPMPADTLREEYVAPRDEFEQNLSEAFKKILGVKEIGIKDDFFKLGGNSLKVMELLSLLDEDELMTPTLIYKGRSVESISNMYKEARIAYLTPEQKEEEGRRQRYPLSRNMKWYWDNVNDGSIDFSSCYQINGIIPSGFLVKGINRYIARNSTFNLVLEEGNGGIPIQVYVPETPFIRAERMSEKQAEEEIRHFIRPFGYHEPLIRIRILRTPLHSYLLFHAFHLITDGAGVHYLIGDMFKSILRKPVSDVSYFGWALEENLRDHSSMIKANLDYFEKKYSMRDYDFCIAADSNTGVTGHATVTPASVSLADARMYCEKAGISMQTFLSAAGVLAQAAYNGTNDNNLCWNYNNRSPKGNHAGLMIRVAFCGIHRDQISTPSDLYADIAKQNEEQLWRLYEYDCYNDITAGADTPAMTITYLEDWFSKATLPSFLGKDIALPNNSAVNPESEKAFALIVTHEDGKLSMTLNYGSSFLTREHAEKFSAMLTHSMLELMQDRLPDFNAFKEDD